MCRRMPSRGVRAPSAKTPQSNAGGGSNKAKHAPRSAASRRNGPCGEFASEDSALVDRSYCVACIPGHHLPKNVGVRKRLSGSLLVRTGLRVVKHSLLGTHRSRNARVLCRASSRGPRLLLWIVGGFQTPALAKGASTAQPVEAIRPTIPRTRSRPACLTGNGSGVNGWTVMPATAAISM